MAIRRCDIQTPSPFSFGNKLKGCTIKELSFKWSGYDFRSDWAVNRDRFKNLIRSISTCPDLLQSLKKIELKYSEIPYDEIEEIFDEFDLDKELITLDTNLAYHGIY